ncbi:MAG TPA: hypothetical protein VM662_15860 [Sphingomonas sp.]|nr:hypothetical protein [Sphingomonas sp.]
MASQPPSGPDDIEREEPGDTQTDPTGASTEEPAEGDEESAPRNPDSPQG